MLEAQVPCSKTDICSVADWRGGISSPYVSLEESFSSGFSFIPRYPFEFERIFLVDEEQMVRVTSFSRTSWLLMSASITD